MSRAAIISVTSGKGGVGKTLTTVNSAIAFRKMGMKVLIIDGDLGLANVDVVLGIKCNFNLRDVIDGHVSIRDIIVDGPMGLRIIPSGSGISSLTNLTYVQRHALLESISQLDEEFDVIIIDTGAGIHDSVRHFNAAADYVVVATTPEPHSMTDAYALIKVMNEHHGMNHFKLLVNQTRSDVEGRMIAERLIEVANRFLNVEIEYLGCVPSDPQVSRAVMVRQAASESSSRTVAGQAWNRIAMKMYAECNNIRRASSENAWSTLLWADSFEHVNAPAL